MFLKKKKSLVKPLSPQPAAPPSDQADAEASGPRLGPLSSPISAPRFPKGSLAVDWRTIAPLCAAAGLLCLVTLVGEPRTQGRARGEAIELMAGDMCTGQSPSQAGAQSPNRAPCLTSDAQPAEIAAYFGVPESAVELLPGEETLRFRIKGTGE